MEVGDVMLPAHLGEHANDDSVESAEFRHSESYTEGPCRRNPLAGDEFSRAWNEHSKIAGSAPTLKYESWCLPNEAVEKPCVNLA